jgi:hypothetical protein
MAPPDGEQMIAFPHYETATFQSRIGIDRVRLGMSGAAPLL